MSRTVTIDGESYTLPTAGNKDWLAAYNRLLLALVDLANGTAERAPGGSIIMFGAPQVAPDTNVYYLFPFYNLIDISVAANATRHRIVVPVAGTISQFYARNDQNGAADGDTIFTLEVNGTPTDLTATVLAGQQNATPDTSDEVEVAAGDLLSLKIQMSGEAVSVGAQRPICSMFFIPS